MLRGREGVTEIRVLDEQARVARSLATFAEQHDHVIGHGRQDRLPLRVSIDLKRRLRAGCGQSEQCKESQKSHSPV